VARGGEGVATSPPRGVVEERAGRGREGRVGAYVTMYNGFGGAVLDTWEEVRPQADVPDLLSLWQKVR
jgi:hypothetical protein